MRASIMALCDACLDCTSMSRSARTLHSLTGKQLGGPQIEGLNRLILLSSIGMGGERQVRRAPSDSRVFRALQLLAHRDRPVQQDCRDFRARQVRCCPLMDRGTQLDPLHVARDAGRYATVFLWSVRPNNVSCHQLATEQIRLDGDGDRSRI